jgi:mono/diheme cytochrome c family protein
MNYKQTISTSSATKLARVSFITTCCIILLAACGGNMRNDSRLKPYEQSAAFADTRSERPIDPNTVARSQSTNLELETGKANGTVIASFPITITREAIAQGQQRYNIYCAPCHGAAADGKGIVSGYFKPRPAVLTDDRLRAAPVGHFYDVITNGYGIMYSYASRVTPAERWAIIAYIRALQANPQAPLDVAPEQIQQAGGAGT